ncbi:MAG TPA: hypothetical protein IAC79_06000 [Candidatus Spyradenecus faecavium]|uniref:Uncharacterized protein n=1 Tax=Candidatus Spyradenecus faecavium TaxID=2840947 RepID=A0A9D1NN04_9BACT|nr:hypothetical protein [Candidatus Spyradenecus faecavium]
MRGWFMMVAAGAAAMASATTVTFSGKTQDRITASAPLAFVSLEPNVGFMATGDAAGDATFLSPNTNIQTGEHGYWTVTFRATEVAIFQTLTLDVGIFNSEGKPQGADTERTATFEATVGGKTVSATHTCMGADPLSNQNNIVTLDFGRVIALGVGDELTVSCKRAEETLGCFFGLKSLSWEDETLTVGAEGLTWPNGAEELTVVFDGGTLTVPSGVTARRLRVVEGGSGTGAIVIASGAALEGADTGEPRVPAFAIPPEVEVRVEAKGALLMDGRLSCPVTAVLGARLGAATENGTLTLDNLTTEGTPMVVQGCLEVYRVWDFAFAEGAVLRRWDGNGYTLRLR